MDEKLKIEYVPIGDIRPYKRNAKLHPPEQIVSMGLATCLLEIVIGICDTPFLYLSRKAKHGDEIPVTIKA